MPLKRGASRAVIGSNIATERAAGKPERVAVAIALHTAHPNGGSNMATKQPPMKVERFGEGGYHNSVENLGTTIGGDSNVDQGMHGGELGQRLRGVVQNLGRKVGLVAPDTSATEAAVKERKATIKGLRYVDRVK